ncbi:RNA-directed DNA polymerase [Ruegeria sp. R13_0]|uniref:reverse transcriptase family protein n=1 Tax=Ruegeria sp. R13_0 TaxID=2821099 RepID=UPI001ADB8DD0|nr:reverse transcriptase family protein [Ruegeria sp. R13_0]MBO9434511.1 RNA-directed DNA polymerase [Ruegeria sp. R13_0]
MTAWRPQRFKAAAGKAGCEQNVVSHAVTVASHVLIRSPGVEPILSLRHLGHLTDTPYYRLRRLVRREDPEPYSVFRIRKRPLPNEKLRFRTIVVPSPWLMDLQRWLNVNVLEHVPPHPASVAFSRGNSVLEAAAPHCGARWLIKMDIKNFFESITERQVYRVFDDIGYEPLVAFELARLCTRVGNRTSRKYHQRYHSPWQAREISEYTNAFMGHLPQGAPTSPRVANLAARDLDKALSNLADARRFTYTRYADDLTFSTSKKIDRADVRPILGEISKIVSENGFSPNVAKTTVSSPGARKVVLGLLVDGEEPRLTREFKQRLRQHLYHLRKHGPAIHCLHNGNATPFGIRNHVLGLVMHARQIERPYGDACLQEFNSIGW